MKSQFHRMRFWVLFFIVYIFVIPLILSWINVSLLGILWVVGLIIVIVGLFVNVRKADKVIAQDKKFKKEVSKTLGEYFKMFIGKELLLFVLFVGYLLALKFFDVDLTVLRIVLGGLVISIFYWLLYKKGILGFLSPEKMEKK